MRVLVKGWALSLVMICHVSGHAGEYSKHTMQSSGEERSYSVYVPKALVGQVKRPAIIAFHGLNSDAGGFRWLTSPDKWAEKHKFVMIYPNAINKSWNAGVGEGRKNTKTNDAKFAVDMVKHAINTHAIAKDKVYVMGFSNGANMVGRMLCENADLIAGAAMVAQSLNEKACQPRRKVPVVLMHGMADPSVPFTGGGKFKLNSHQYALDFFRKWYGINKALVPTKQAASYKCLSSKDNDNVAVVGCRLYKDGHQWPGSRDFLVKQLGSTNKDLQAHDFIMQFFKNYAQKPTVKVNLAKAQARFNAPKSPPLTLAERYAIIGYRIHGSVNGRVMASTNK